MTQLKIEIELGNAAITGENSGTAVADILKTLASKFDSTNLHSLMEDQFQPRGVIRDENGNRVGEWYLDDPTVSWAG